MHVYRRQADSDKVEAKMNTEAVDRNRLLTEARQLSNQLEGQLAVEKKNNAKAPSSQLKQLVERLKNQLASKEKQHQVLREWKWSTSMSCSLVVLLYFVDLQSIETYSDGNN